MRAATRGKSARKNSGSQPKRRGQKNHGIAQRMKTDLLPQGADLLPQGVRYRVWAPGAQSVRVELWRGREGAPAWTNPPDVRLPLILDASGYFHGVDTHGRAGDFYKFKLNGGQSLPDPASRWQPHGVHGPSQVIDPDAYDWRDG